LEQTTLNRRQVLLQANEFSPETVWSHCICIYDAVDFIGPHTEGVKVGPLERWSETSSSSDVLLIKQPLMFFTVFYAG
jgi:hypothetical protein